MPPHHGFNRPSEPKTSGVGVTSGIHQDLVRYRWLPDPKPKHVAGSEDNRGQRAGD